MNSVKKYCFNLFVFTCASHLIGQAQETYTDSLKDFQASYVKAHDVVKGNDKKSMHFFPVSEVYRVTARFERIEIAPWFKMATSGKDKQVYRVYGILHFKLKDTLLKLEVYESQDLMKVEKYADHLFIPFTDLTCGEESYENGRYIDVLTGELTNDTYVIDFNKAYNPYCAYISDRYNCPIPPKANNLTVAVRAGEMKFGKAASH
jgi:uncharacterized protein (DUF1684 family)